MKSLDILRTFAEGRDKRVFSFNEILSLTGDKREVLRVELSRLSRKGMLFNIKKGWYANPFNSPEWESESVLEEAAEIYKPSYISFDSALSFLGILSQIPTVVTLATKNSSKHTLIKGGRIEYIQVPDELFFGYRKIGYLTISENEKALLDYVWLRFFKKGRKKSLNNFEFQSLCSHLDDMFLDQVKYEKVLSYGRKYGDNIMPTFERALEEVYLKGKGEPSSRGMPVDFKS